MTTTAARVRTPVPITCRHCGRVRLSRAAEGQQSRCSGCGRKLPRVPVNARRPPGSHPELSIPLGELSETDGYAASWAAERGKPKLGAPVVDELCPDCGGAQEWEPRRTLIMCTVCRRFRLPTAVVDRVKRAKLQARAGVSTPDERMTERVQLRAGKRLLAGEIVRMADHFALDGIEATSPAGRTAAQYRETFLAYLPEVDAAESVHTLTIIERVVTNAWATAEQYGAVREIERARSPELVRAYKSNDIRAIEQARAALRSPVTVEPAPGARAHLDQSDDDQGDELDDQGNDADTSSRLPWQWRVASAVIVIGLAIVGARGAQ